ncbi:hypothetical protein O181_030051 [Austropuccinia psidii MF-1]|uniref:Chromo domain-containing protein n=1 Tax=Austropuccinia psidii MF-1 TaxID=1389203 RepID=A0A9Q3CS81_9BASI|nr:hypothetical protein [Austropuccinia psidii MF-1]
MNQLLAVLNGSTIFSKIDLCGAYNLLRIKDGGEHLTAFRTKYGSYEYLIIPFGLTNAPASFQNLVNDLFEEFLDIFFVVYLDDIMVFSSSEEEHVKNVASFLQRLRDNNLFAKVSHKYSIGLSPRTSKLFNPSLDLPISIVVSLKITPKKSLLSLLFLKKTPFIFNQEASSQFQILKEEFTTAPILSHFDPSLQTIMETDASDCALGAVLSQEGWPLHQIPCHVGTTWTQRGRWTSSERILRIFMKNPSFDSIHVSQDSPAGKLSTKLQSVKQVVKEELESEIRRFKKYADRNRAIPPDFQPGDKVWLASKTIKTIRPTKKLSERWLGPFEVLKKIGSYAYHLKLSQQWKSVHPVFHVSLLEPVKQSNIPNRHHLPPPPLLVEEQEEWEVAQVLDSKLKRGKLWYLVEWKRFSEDPERTAWEPASNLTNSPDLVKDFHSLYPGKPDPNTSRV